MEAPATIYYRAKSTKNVLSDVYPLTLAIYPRPMATDIVYPGIRAVIDVLKNDSVTYTLEDNKLDPETIEFFSVKPDDENQPMPMIAGDGKSAIVEGQGKWSITKNSYHVVFKPEKGFKGVPSPIYYTVMDTKGSESNPARITLSEANMDLRKMVADMAALSQRDFWARYKSTLNGQSLDTVLVVSYQLTRLFLSMMNEAQILDINTAPGITETERDRIFMAWMDADFSIGNLVDETDNINQSSLGLTVPRNNLGARVLRLREVMRALDKYFDAFEEATT